MSELTLNRRDDGARLLSTNDGKVIECSRFEALKGSCSGAVFIVASGPTVKDFPLARYAHLPMMAMNGSIACFEGTGIRPLFYLCDDSDVAEKKIAAVGQGMRQARHAALNLGALEQVQRLDPAALRESDLYLMERVNRWQGVPQLSDRRFAWSVRNNPDYVVAWSPFSQKRSRIGFSRNFANGYFTARTIPYAAVQLAFYLGFSQVFLVGVDMRPELGQFYDPSGKVVRSCLDEDFESHILPSFQLLGQRVAGPGFRVYNLSPISRIPDTVIPKLSLDQLDAVLAGQGA